MEAHSPSEGDPYVMNPLGDPLMEADPYVLDPWEDPLMEVGPLTEEDPYVKSPLGDPLMEEGPYEALAETVYPHQEEVDHHLFVILSS